MTRRMRLGNGRRDCVGRRLGRNASRVLLSAFAAGLCALPLAAQQPESDIAASFVAADANAAANSPSGIDASEPLSDDDAAASAALRLREGTQLTDHLGYFRQNGESLMFVDKDGRELGGLPNLGLERIIRMLKSVEEPESVMWSISGTITEFAGRNYLLINRAVFKAATLPPAPETIGE